MNRQNQRRWFFSNKLHREMFFIFVCAAAIPTLVTTVSLFYLIFSITASQFAIPEAIIYNIIPAAQKVLTILFIALPLILLAILSIAHRVTYRVVGPFDRIVRELSECIDGKKKDHIVLRKHDKFQPLVDKINILLDRLGQK
ncbi:MAG: hypothetical protein ABH954_00350 [Candidatus Omnitrophota bacterium]